MDKEEIKRTVSMRDVLARYGIYPNRSGFISCPFHKEKTASCKIYKHDFHCFGCGENGDIFYFVQKMEGLTFKEAYISLGGDYEKPESMRDARIRQRKMLAAKQMHQRAQERKEKSRSEMLRLCEVVDDCRIGMNGYEPFSDLWCVCAEQLSESMCRIDLLMEEEKEVT